MIYSGANEKVEIFNLKMRMPLFANDFRTISRELLNSYGFYMWHKLGANNARKRIFWNWNGKNKSKNSERKIALKNKALQIKLGKKN